MLNINKKKFVGVISPSAAAPNKYEYIFDYGVDKISEILEMKVKELPHTRSPKELIYNHPEIRAKDIMDAFIDDDISIIITSIGGNDSIRVLEYLDIDIIKKNSKPIMGFSDSTTLLTYLNQHGIPTLHGPSIMAGFSEPEPINEEFKKHVRDFILGDSEEYEYKNYTFWTDEELDINNLLFYKKNKKKHINKGWKILQSKNKILEGEIYGGNIEVLEMLKGTRFMEDINFLKDKVLILETSESKPPVWYIHYALRSMGARGVFKQVKGILFGRFSKYSQKEKDLIEQKIMLVMNEYSAGHLTIITNLDFGHTQPQWILPLGKKINIDIKNKTIKIKKDI